MRLEIEKKSLLDLLQITAGFLFLFLFPKVQKNLNYLISKYLPSSLLPSYFHLNFFDCILVGVVLYCLLKRIPLIPFFRRHKSLLFLSLLLIWTRISLVKVDPLYLSRAQVMFFTFFTSCMCFPLVS